MDKTELSLKIGLTETLTATVIPEDADDKTIVWSTSATRIATVDSNGKITAKSVGTATVKATTVNGLSATCTVTVTDAEL